MAILALGLGVATADAKHGPCHGPLVKLNHSFPAHGLGSDGFHMSARGVRLAAENGGFNPREAIAVEQISRGESGRQPGIVSWDLGYGLTQLTPRVWGSLARAVLDRLGGLHAALNPLRNMRMAHWLFLRGGWGHWYGTRYLNFAVIPQRVPRLLKPKWRCR